MSPRSSREKMGAVRDKIVLAALPHVPFDGWSRKALIVGAKDAGFDEAMLDRAFPKGAVDAVVHFSDLADRKLEEEAAEADLDSMKFSARIEFLVRRRLEAWQEHREAVRRAVTLLAMPVNVPAGVRAAWKTADAIWYAAGDASVDFSFYTRRATLLGIFSATVLVWLEDRSENFENTWDFLDRRIADTGRIGKWRSALEMQLKSIPNPFKGFSAMEMSKTRRSRYRPSSRMKRAAP